MIQVEKKLCQFLIESSPVMIYWKDNDGRYMACNQTAARNLGFENSEEIIGKNDDELPVNSEYAALYRQNDLYVMGAGMARVFEEPISVHGIEHVFLSHKAPFRDEEGNISGVFGVSIDITERAYVTEQWNHDKDQAAVALSNIVADMPGHVYWKNLEGIYLGCNDKQAQSLGMNAGEEIVGKTDFELPWNKTDAERFRENDLRIIKSEKTETMEELATVNGLPSVVLSQKSPFKNKDGEIMGVLGISVDVTKQKRAEENLNMAKMEAETANKAKTEFIRNMEHDIRTPFSGLLGVADLLFRQEEDPVKKELLGAMQQSAKELLDYLNSILDFSRIEFGSLAIQEKKISLKKLLERIVTIEKPAALHKHLYLNLKYGEDLPLVLIGDQYRLERILINLVSNAIKFTRKGGVSLEAELLENANSRHTLVRFIVKDTGIGVPPDKIDYIYEKFTRLTPSNQGVYKGAGLGLRVVKEFTDDLEGELEVDSQEGSGTIFYCTLPMRMPLTDDLIDAHVVARKPLEKKTVLIVEDVELAQMMEVAVLEELGCTVDKANDGAAAIKLVRKNSYDLVFMDLGLPDMTGIDAATIIRKQEADGKVTPIVALTAHAGDKEYQEKCKGAGMNGVLVKPLLKDIAEEALRKYAS